MSEEELKRCFEIYKDCWNHLKQHCKPNDTDTFWNTLRDDGSVIGKKYDDPIEHQLVVDLITAANGVIQRYYRRNKDVLR